MHDDTTPLTQVHDAFTRLMRWANRGDVRRFLLGTAAEALSMTDVTLLRAVAKHGPVRVSDLAVWQGVDKSTVTPQVRRLEDRGLVARQGDPADRRAALLTVTDRGRQKIHAMDEAGAQLFERALESWPAEDRHTLAVLMQRLADDLAVVPKESVLHVRQHP